MPATSHTEITPVTRKLTVIHLRSSGADGKPGTSDDFDVAAFSKVISDQTSPESKARVWRSSIVLVNGTGAISGIISDPNGAVVPGANITATLNSQTFTATSDSDGKYTMLDLPPGIYEVRVQATGFMISVVTNVVVEVSNLTTVDFALRPGAATETVTVTAAAPQTQTTANASVADVRELATNGRSYGSVHFRGRVNVITKSGGPLELSTPHLREYFPETLVWQPSIETDNQGRAQLSFRLADNITTWKMSVIGSTEDGQIGTAEKEIKAFQPFFVEHDPPRVLTEGDEISLPVVVRNYLDRPQQVDLEIKPENWFSLLGPEHNRTSVAAGDAARATFNIRATTSVKDGKQRITATAANGNDAIERPVSVHPDGAELSATASDIVGRSATLELKVPEATIPNSVRAELKIYPNLMAHVVESVEAIIERPYGCGEQTISSTYPSLLLMRHYKQTGDDFPLRTRAQRYLQNGYSRLLNYRDENGGFTYWGRGEPDVALTAYALRFLTEAREVISVDDDVTNQAREWLVKQQRADGSWAAHAYWSTSEDKRRTLLLTAYVAHILAMTQRQVAQRVSDPSLALKHALDYVGAHIGEINEPYILAAYALAAIEAQNTGRVAAAITRLRSLAHADGGTAYWSLETNTPFYGWGQAGRVETTALVVQALSQNCRLQKAECALEDAQTAGAAKSELNDAELVRRGLLFLLRQKDRYGVWYSTQATINVLDAMLGLLSKTPPQGNVANQSAVDMVVNGRTVQTMQMPAVNRLSNPIALDLSQFLRNGTNLIEIRRANGSPYSSAQAIANYYVPWSASDLNSNEQLRAGETGGLRLVAKFDKTEATVKDEITCHVEAERVGFHGYGMMLAEIGLPPGADVDRDSLETAMKSSDWAISQYDVLPDRVIVYLWPRAGGVKFDFRFRPRFGMNAKAARSLLYDYYNPEARALVAPSKFTIK